MAQGAKQGTQLPLLTTYPLAQVTQVLFPLQVKQLLMLHTIQVPDWRIVAALQTPQVLLDRQLTQLDTVQTTHLEPSVDSTNPVVQVAH